MKTKIVIIAGFLLFLASATTNAQSSTTTTTYYGNRAGNAKYPCKGSLDAVCKSITVVTKCVGTGIFSQYIISTYVTYNGNIYKVSGNSVVDHSTGAITSGTTQWVAISQGTFNDESFFKAIDYDSDIIYPGN